MSLRTISGLEVDPRLKKVTLTGIAMLLSFWLCYCIIYALSYPVQEVVGNGVLTMAFGGAWPICNLVLSAIGLAVIALRAKRYSRGDWLVSLAFGALIWLSIQSRYWLTGTTTSVPFVYPTFAGLETFLMTLGAIGLLKDRPVLHLRLAEKDPSAAVRGLFLGALIGLPFAALNVLLAQGSGMAARGQYDVIFGAIVAVQPGLMEEVAFRLMFLGLAIVVLSRFLPEKAAVWNALFLSIVFHAALHVQDMLTANPVAALVSVALMSVLFGLPMALLAYKRDVESAVGFHWVIDAVRFSIFSF